jgi:type I restriction enzyme S subunit
MSELKTKNTKAFYNTEIPSDWNVKKLGEISEIKTGDKDTQNKTDDGLYPFFVRSDNVERINSFSYDAEAILTSGDGVGVGKNYHYINGKFDFHQRVYSIRKFDIEVYGKFIYYYFSEKFYERVQKLSAKNSVDSVRMEMIFDMKIPLPPLPEQKAIAQVLSTADAAIHTTEKLIAQKELCKKWLMQQLLTGKKRLKGFEGEWKEHSYEKILKVVKRNFDWDENELYKLISVRRRSGGIFYREALYGHQILVKTLRSANEGDFLFSKMQILHGASALVTKEFDGAKISGSYIAVVPKDKEQLNMEFFQWYSQTPYFYHQTYISSYGVHIEKMTFDFDTFLQLEMKLPSIEEQTAIAQVLQAADKEINLLKAKADRLREQKKGLMQVLLTGKVRLKV